VHNKILWEVIFIEKILQNILNTNFRLIKKIGLISLTVTIFSTLSFLITYHFLYGYYFGGEMNSFFSNFELIRRFVPFHLNTMGFTYLMISLSASLIIYLLALIRGRKLVLIAIATLGLIFFHITMSVFFTRDLTLNNIIYFSGIWVIPIIIAGLIIFTMRGMRYPFKTYSGITFGLLFFSILMSVFKLNFSEEWLIICIIILLFGFGILFSIIKYNKYWNFIFFFPYTMLLIIVIMSFVTIDIFIRNLMSLVIAVLLSIVLPRYFKGKLREGVQTKGEPTNFVGLIMNPKTRTGALVFFIIVLLGTYVLIPRVSMATAKIIRTFTPETESQHERIYIRDFNDELKSIKGIIVAEQDDVIYISNEKWELEQVKTDKYHVKKHKE